MDLSRFDPREAAEAGVEVPLVIGGETVIGDDGKPVTFTIKGTASEPVHAASMEVQRRRPATPDEVIENDKKVLRAAVIRWSANFVLDGKKLGFSPENREAVIGIPLVRQHLVFEVYRDANFLPTP